MTGSAASCPPPTIAIEDIRAAAARLEGVAHRTPAVTSRMLDKRTGSSVVLRAENLQRAESFKFRGAYNKISTLTSEELSRGVCAWSSGNHAQAVALAACMFDTTATVVMPQDAPAAKRAATEAYGAKVVTYDRYREDREAKALALSRELGLVPVPAFGDDTRRSLLAGERVRIPVPHTIADGQQVEIPGALTFEVNKRHLTDVLLVDDSSLTATMAFVFERLKLVIEPSGGNAGIARFTSLFASDTTHQEASS